MKTYKKIMDGLAFVEEWVAMIVMVVVTVLTAANVFGRYVLQSSLTWSEELVVAALSALVTEVW